jgi:hypothetical protein
VKVFKCDGKIVVIKQIVVVKKKFDGKPYGHMPYEQMPADPPSKRDVHDELADEQHADDDADRDRQRRRFATALNAARVGQSTS